MSRIIRSNRLLGIIVCTTRQYPPFFERHYYEQLTRIGTSLGITVVVFSPKSVSWPRRQVQGYVYNPVLNKWLVSKAALPTVIYDRCFYLNSHHYQSYQPFIQKLRQDSQTKLLGVPLKGKWQLAELVAQSPLSRYLPHTERYTNMQDALSFIQKYRALVAKPIGGSHGRGIVAIFHKTNNRPCYVVGRTKGNASLSQTFPTTKQALDWLDRFIGTNRYILQPYLHLRTPNNTPFDIRVLMQKDERQVWQMTGMAVRTGNPHSLTSNLHGGGKAEKIVPFLKQLFYDKQTAHRIEKEIVALCQNIPLLIEKKHGRLCELGVDIGIDTRERVWLLEVNSKPGRQVFRHSGEKQLYLTAVKRPLMYACSLLEET